MSFFSLVNLIWCKHNKSHGKYRNCTQNKNQKTNMYDRCQVTKACCYGPCYKKMIEFDFPFLFLFFPGL